MQKKDPKIMVEFFLLGEGLEFELMTSSLQIQPDRVRKKEEFPKQSIDLGFAKDIWKIKTGYERSRAVSDQLGKMVGVLDGKQAIINQLQDKYDGGCKFVIVIQANAENMPEVVLPKEYVSFAGEINAAIDFDIYVYPEDHEF